MSSELPNSLVRSLLLSMELLGHDAKLLWERLPRPSGSRSRSGWDDLVSALETFFSLEGVAATQRLMRELATRSSMALTATELLGDARTTYQVLLEAAASIGPVHVTTRSAAGGLVVHLELPKSHRPSMVFFQSCVWFLAALPRARGLTDARVLPERLSERELHCLVLPPATPGLTLQRTEGQGKGLANDTFRLVRQPTESSRAVPSAQVLQHKFGLTRAEARVVRRLAEGQSVQHIAKELGVSPETARTHAKRAMQKTDTHRQAELVSLVLQTKG